MAAEAVGRTIEAYLRQPATAVLHHDLREVRQGVVHRRLRIGDADEVTVLELAHGCVSCTLREDLLPTIHRLSAQPDVRRIVLHLDPALEPEQVCWALVHVLSEGRLVTDAADLRGIVSVVDVGTWLQDATSDAEVAERGLARLPDDERTIAQLVVGQTEFADLLVTAGDAEPWETARTQAVLARLAPSAPRLPVTELDERIMLDTLPSGARRGRPDHPYAPLLSGQPPLGPELGVQLFTFTARRPFHPDRLHDALGVLLDGVVRARGRIWLATRPEAVLWLESAGGGLQIGHVGDWLAAGSPEDWDQAPPERRAMAALRWHDRWGDRVQEIQILAHDADPEAIDTALRAALIDDAELAAGEDQWRHLPDPFGSWHADPCEDATQDHAAEQRQDSGGP